MDNTTSSTEDTFKEKLEKRIPYNEAIFQNEDNYEMIIDDLIDASKYIVLSLKYPFVEDYSEMEIPDKYVNWRYRCCLELYRGLGKEGISSYSENGLSWSRLTDGLSSQLIDEIIPKVGVPTSSSTTSEEE